MQKGPCQVSEAGVFDIWASLGAFWNYMQSNIEEIGAPQVCIMAGIALQLIDTLAPKIFTKLASSSSPGLLQLYSF